MMVTYDGHGKCKREVQPKNNYKTAIASRLVARREVLPYVLLLCGS